MAAHDEQDVLVWAHAFAVDGPLSQELTGLLDLMAAYSGGWATLP